MTVVERGGVRKSVWLLATAMALVALALFGMLRMALDGNAEDRPPETPAKVVAPAPSAPPVLPPRPGRLVRRAPPALAPVAEPAAEVEPPHREDPIVGLGAPGERTGMALFPPPGTDPPKRGILVPEDFELPPGYARHYQTTDDGQPLAAILMFHPDYEWVDESGAPVALPEDRVVPAEMAPPGLPLQMLEIPGEAAPGGAP